MSKVAVSILNISLARWLLPGAQWECVPTKNSNLAVDVGRASSRPRQNMPNAFK